MIENTRIITGTRQEVESELQEYLSGHPNAKVLSSSHSVQAVLDPVISSTESTGTKPAENKEAKDTKDKPAKEAKEPKPKEITYITHVCVIVGHVFP
jgi:hypothetical protein